MSKSQPRELTEAQAKRYSRHILIPTMDWEGQERLVSSRALVLGLGGLGCSVAQYIATSGVGHITLVDDDCVDLSNLQRQVLHSEKDVGLNKAVSAKESLMQLNSDISISAITHRLEADELRAIARNMDVLIDCTDNLASRNLLNQISVETLTPLVTGAAIRMEGQVVTYLPTDSAKTQEGGSLSPCYACLSYLFGEQELNCMESGVIAPLVGIIGSMQALEVIKLLSGVGTVSGGKMLMFDAATSQWREMKIVKKTDCNVCGNVQ